MPAARKTRVRRSGPYLILATGPCGDHAFSRFPRRAYNAADMASISPQIAVSASALTDDPRRAPQLSRRLGFAGLVFPAASSAGDVTELSAPGRREFRQLFSSQDQQFVALAADLGPRGFAPGADVDRVLARLDRVLEAARG